MIFLGLQAKQATELKMLLQLPDPKCWCHPDCPPPRLRNRNTKTGSKNPVTGAGWAAGGCSWAPCSKGSTTGRQQGNQGWDLTNAGTDNILGPSWPAFKNRNNRNHCQFTNVQTQMSGVFCSFSSKDCPEFLLPKNNSNSVSVVPPSTLSFCLRAGMNHSVHSPGLMSQSSPHRWSVLEIPRH